MRLRGAGRVGFLALRTTITAELAAGWPMAEVFRRHQAELGIQVGQVASLAEVHLNRGELFCTRFQP
jgi:hypothetical protein